MESKGRLATPQRNSYYVHGRGMKQVPSGWAQNILCLGKPVVVAFSADCMSVLDQSPVTEVGAPWKMRQIEQAVLGEPLSLRHLNHKARY